jgi:membrane associated rhomboid family serine protease
MEPNYGNIDPEERTNKVMAALSLILGLFSVIAVLIPVCGFVTGLAGIGLGIFGRRSGSRRLATVGIAISVFGIIFSVVYGYLLYIKNH